MKWNTQLKQSSTKMCRIALWCSSVLLVFIWPWMSLRNNTPKAHHTVNTSISCEWWESSCRWKRLMIAELSIKIWNEQSFLEYQDTGRWPSWCKWARRDKLANNGLTLIEPRITETPVFTNKEINLWSNEFIKFSNARADYVNLNVWIIIMCLL